MEDTQYLINIGKNIRRIREEKNVLQADLAYLCDMDYQNLSSIERGKFNLTIKTLVRVAKALNVEPYELLIM